MTKSNYQLGLTNRPITPEEVNYRLRLKDWTDDALSHLGVIRLNSSWVELIDSHHNIKGTLTIFPIPFLWLFFWYAFPVVIRTLPKIGSLPDHQRTETIFLAIIGIIGWSALVWVWIWMLRWDAFKPRYSPIRLNRKTRMVHILRNDGTVASAPWEKAFFTAFPGVPPYTTIWGLKCLILDEDGETVRDVFMFNYQGSHAGVMRLWSFMCRYMEEGPQAVADKVPYYIPIARFGENPIYGFCRFLLNYNKSLGVQIFMSPLLVVFSIGRIISMLTGSTPKWPKQIEESCAVDPNDPWIRDSRNNPPLLPGIFSAIRDEEDTENAKA